MPAVGTSMVPAIQPGDLLSIQPVNPKEVLSGDIVVYARDERLIVHRIVRTSAGSSGACLVTRGDRLLRDDPPVPGDDLLGRVTRIERKQRLVNLRPFSNVAQRALCMVLRRSDRATYLFLRIKGLWSGLFSKGNAWQA